MVEVVLQVLLLSHLILLLDLLLLLQLPTVVLLHSLSGGDPSCNACLWPRRPRFGGGGGVGGLLNGGRNMAFDFKP